MTQNCVASVTYTYCRQILMKFDPYPLQITDVLNGWSLTLFSMQRQLIVLPTYKVRSIMTSESSPSRNKDYFSQVHTILIHPSSAEISICRAQ